MQVGSILHHQVSHVIRTYGKYFDEISVRYFKGIHRWLPIVSRQRFHDQLMNSQSPAAADFSVLLLSMCLIISHLDSDFQNKELDQETLYLTTKLLFAHALSVISVSTSLIQASLLIATYEYAHGLGNAAYISIGTCARLALAAGLDKAKLDRPFTDDTSPNNIPVRLLQQEERNLWWGIVICER